MHAQDDRDQLSPPRPPGRLRAVALSVAVHSLLVLALAWGVNWKSSTESPVMQAELWAAVPQQAAPREVQAPPPQPEPEYTPPTPAPQPKPIPAPKPATARAAEPSDDREAEIALEQKKRRLEQQKKERQQQLEKEKRERENRERQERLEREKKERLQKEKEKEKEQRAKEARENELKEKERRKKQAEQAELAEKEKQKKLAEDKRKAELAAQAKRQADAEARQLAAQREANLRRMQGLAGASGGETATGNAQHTAGPGGPSGSYGGKVAAKVKPNIIYPDAIAGNPRAVVEVRAAPDGTITSIKLVQSSGNKSWDAAVQRALEKTETLPRDVDGRIPTTLEIGFRPQD